MGFVSKFEFTADSSSSLSGSVTVPTLENSLLCFVCVSHEELNQQALTVATLGGVNLQVEEQLIHAGGINQGILFTLKQEDLPSAGSQTLTITFGAASADIAASVIFWDELDQTYTYGSLTTNTNEVSSTNTTSVTLSPSSASDLVLDMAYSNSALTGTVGNGYQTERSDLGGTDSSLHVSTAQQSVSTDMDWTLSATAARIGHIGVLVSADIPEVSTDAATNVDESSADLNGEHFVGSVTERGFVYGTTSFGNPGNTAPASTSYDLIENETGSFSAETFSLSISSLMFGATYYFRAYIYDGATYEYGLELSFITSGNLYWATEETDESPDGTTKYLLEVSTSALSGAITATQYDRRMLSLPVVEDSTSNLIFGIEGLKSATIEIDNADGQLNNFSFDNLNVRLWHLKDSATKLLEGQVRQWSKGFSYTIFVSDLEVTALQADLPKRIIDSDTYPNATDLGREIPIIFGQQARIPLLYVNADEVSSEYDFIIGEGVGLNSNNFNNVTAVYRNDSALIDIEGTIDSATSTTVVLETADKQADSFYKFFWIEITSGAALGEIKDVTAYDGSSNTVTVSSTWATTPSASDTYRLREWRFYDGSQSSPYQGLAFIRFKKRLGSGNSFDAIYADVDGLQDEVNVVRAIQSVLTNSTWGLGLTVNTASFNTAAALSDITSLDCEGAVVSRTQASIVLEELLSFRDMILSKGENGIEISVDQTKSSSATFGINDTKGLNNIVSPSTFAVEYLDHDETTKNVIVNYRRNIKNGEYMHSISRSSNSVGVDTTFDFNFIFTHDTADRITDYKRKRLQGFREQIVMQSGQDASTLSKRDLVTIEVPSLSINNDYEILGIRRLGEELYDISLMKYINSYTYEASGDLPDNENLDQITDFDNTPPTPVTNLNSATSVEVADDGTIISLINLTWDEPEENYSGSKILYKLSSEADTEYRTVTTGAFDKYEFVATAGQSYGFRVVAQNINGSVDALPVATGTIVAAGDTTAPSAPSTPSSEIKFRTFTFTLSSYTKPDDFKWFEWQVRSGSTVIETYETPSLAINHTEDGTASASRDARVRAVDYSGNVSAWSSDSTIRTTSDILNGDMGLDSVDTPELEDDGVDEDRRIDVLTASSSSSGTVSAGAVIAASHNQIISHGKVPIAVVEWSATGNTTLILYSFQLSAMSSSNLVFFRQIYNPGGVSRSYSYSWTWNYW